MSASWYDFFCVPSSATIEGRQVRDSRNVAVAVEVVGNARLELRLKYDNHIVIVTSLSLLAQPAGPA